MNECKGETSTMHRNGELVETKLLRIAAKSRKEPRLQFTNLFHLLKTELLRECFARIRKDAAAGMDGQTKDEYAENLEANLKALQDKLHRMAYIPQPVRRVYIPKPGKKEKRPLGIPALEDKLVQAGMVRIMESIYEQDFIEDSYGFRPGRNCHMALRELGRTIDKRPVNYIVEADIKGFFDNVSHEWMMKFLAYRITDTRIQRMVIRFLKSGIMDNGKIMKSEKGTVQGGTISPLLANIYLHYVLDLWFEKVYRKECIGYARLIRYADDFVVCFQKKEEAEDFIKALAERLKKFGLELEMSKSRLLEFGRYALENVKRKGTTAGTFDFLGFTHYCGLSRKGVFRMKRKTSRKKFTAKLKAFNFWLKMSRTLPTAELMARIQRSMKGYYAYYGVTDNSKSLQKFLYQVRRLLHKWLNRRGKRNSLNWENYARLLVRYPLPQPRIKVCLY